MKRLTDLIGSVFGYDNVGVAGEFFFRLFVQKLRAACEIVIEWKKEKSIKDVVVEKICND